MNKYYIKTEKGYFKDLILPSFVSNTKEAFLFKNLIEARKYVKALKEMEGIHAVIEEDDFADDTELQMLLDVARKVVRETEANAAANPSTDEILVVVVEPGKKPYKKVIPNSLDSMKEIVGGWIENVFIGETKMGARVGIVLNEEGKLIGLPANRRIHFQRGSDTLVGNLFITAYNMQGDNVTLTDAEAEFYIKRFAAQDVYFYK